VVREDMVARAWVFRKGTRDTKRGRRSLRYIICRNPDLAEEQREQRQRDMVEIEKGLKKD
jgi:hypothetical protein